jgi:transcription-repair coupling factor (superfamily II helicase)
VKLDFVNLSPAADESENAAFLPYGYIEDERLRIEVYRRMAESTAKRDLSSLAEELTDRFGRMPDTVSRLLAIAHIRIAASRKGIGTVETRDDRLMMLRRGDYLMSGSRFPRLTAPGVDERLNEILDLIHAVDEWSET